MSELYCICIAWGVMQQLMQPQPTVWSSLERLKWKLSLVHFDLRSNAVTVSHVALCRRLAVFALKAMQSLHSSLLQAEIA